MPRTGSGQSGMIPHKFWIIHGHAFWLAFRLAGTSRPHRPRRRGTQAPQAIETVHREGDRAGARQLLRRRPREFRDAQVLPRRSASFRRQEPPGRALGRHRRRRVRRFLHEGGARHRPRARPARPGAPPLHRRLRPRRRTADQGPGQGIQTRPVRPFRKEAGRTRRFDLDTRQGDLPRHGSRHLHVSRGTRHAAAQGGSRARRSRQEPEGSARRADRKPQAARGGRLADAAHGRGGERIRAAEGRLQRRHGGTRRR
jgi:hypothetical protein